MEEGLILRENNFHIFSHKKTPISLPSSEYIVTYNKYSKKIPLKILIALKNQIKLYKYFHILKRKKVSYKARLLRLSFTFYIQNETRLLNISFHVQNRKFFKNKTNDFYLRC